MSLTRDGVPAGGRWAAALAAIVLAASAPPPASVIAGQDVIVGDFSASGLTGWREEVFKDKTHYEPVRTEIGTVLKADSNASASGLYREMDIDLEKTPCLKWSWKVAGILDGLDETTKGGDDYPARVYVVFSGGLAFWKTRALNYVWSNGRPINSAWPNAFTDRSVNIAAQSGTGRIGQWVSESHDVRKDYRRLIGGDVKRADAVAIMTDTDNSGRAATAFYDNIRFSPSC